MAGTRTLKLSILADVDDLKRKLNQADNDVSTFGDKVSKMGQVMAAAFAAAAAAAAAYATKLAVDGVKSALEDEAAQARLAQTLKAATGATEAQIKATEQYITKMQLATGVSDTDLRAAMGRLALSTESVTKAQELLSLALDISKARGLPLETVANALGKAYDGQTTALGKLGIGLSSAELKGKSFGEVQDRLNSLFGGAASAAADTYQGRLDRMKQLFSELVEGIGYKFLPIISKIADFIMNTVVPNFGKFLDIFKPIGDAIERNRENFQKFADLIQTYVIPVVGVAFVAALKVIGEVAGFILDVIGKVAGGITSVVNGAISAINVLIKAYNAIPFLPNVSTIPSLTAPSISVPKVGATAPSTSIPTISSSGTGGSTSGTGSSTSGADLTLPTITKAQIAASNALDTMGGNNQAYLNYRAGEQTGGAATANITVNMGVVGDPESAARTIVQLLNESDYRGTGAVQQINRGN